MEMTLNAGTILIIEDDAGTAELLAEAIAKLGCAAATALDGAEALAYLERAAVEGSLPLAIALDYRLPDIDGEELINRFTQRCAALGLENVAFPPFIVVTGQGDERVAARMMKRGARDYIVKDEHFLDLFPLALQATARAAENEQKLRAAERALNQSEQNFRMAISALGEGVVVIDKDGVIQVCNKRAEEILGQRREDIIGKKVAADEWGTISEDGSPLAGDDGPIMATIQTGQPIVNTIVGLRRAGGGILWVLINGQPIFNVETGELEASVVSFTDITAQKNQERELRESKELYALLANNTQDLVALHALDGTFLYVSPSFERVAGYSPNDLIGINSYQFFHPDDVERIREYLRAKVLGGDENEPIVYRFRTKDGSYLWLETNATPIIQPVSGEVVKILTSSRDVSKRVQAEEEMRLLALIAKETDNMVIITDAEGRIEWVNEGFTRISEYTLEEVIGKTPGRLLQGPKTDPETVKFMARARALGEPFVVEALNYSKSGKEYWAQIHSEPLRDPSGRVEKFFSLQLDITELKRREAQLRQSEAQLRAVFDSSTQYFLFADINLRVLGYNKPIKQTSRALFNRDIEIGDLLTEYVLSDHRETFLYSVQKALAGESVTQEQKVALPSGEEQWYEYLYAPTYSNAGEIIGLTLSATNITERKLASLTLEAMNQRLELRVAERTEELLKLNRELSEIMGIATHDLKNPLSGILSSVEILERYITGESQTKERRFLQTIKLAGEQMLRIITNLLDLNRIESGLSHLEKKPIALQCVSEIVDEYQERAAKKGIVILYENPTESASLQVFADENAVRQILDNLISNAVKYSPHYKRIWVRAQKPTPEKVRIEVQDEGPGLTAKDKERLFQKFARLSAQPTGGEHSTGLGLSIVKRLVEMQDGSIHCESEAGKGATFVVELPAAM
jgi:PAS domain S-box-containing protein